MKTTVLVLLTVFTVFGMGMERLDSIVTKSRDLRNDGVKGFIMQKQQSQQLITPDELFGEMDRVDDAEEVEPPAEEPMEELHRRSRQRRLESEPSAYVPYDRYIDDLETKNKEVIELRIQIDRLTTAISHIVDHSADQKKMVEMLTKFLELLTPLLLAIGGLFGWNKVKARRKKNGEGTQVINTPT